MKKKVEKIIEKMEVEVNLKEPIYIKYEKVIEQSRSNYLKGLNYNDTMEILRYVEKRLGRQMPINVGCGECVLNLVKLFDRMEKTNK